VVFQATGGKKIDEQRGKLNGNLTIRDVTRPLTLDVEYLGQAKSPWGTTNAGFAARTKINRKDWGLTWNVALETGGWLVSEDINIEIEIEFTQVPEPAQQPEAAAVAAS
ncbi:MAG: YceI family protein, partial [Rudaea sp.]